MLNCLFFRIFSSVRMKWVWASARYLAFGRTPEHRRLAKCDAGSSRTGGFFPAAAGILCVGLGVLHLYFPALPARWRNVGFCTAAAHHTRRLGRKPHTAATRASRRGAGARSADRVDRVDFLHGGKIVTFGTSEQDQPLSIAAVGLDQNSVFP